VYVTKSYFVYLQSFLAPHQDSDPAPQLWLFACQDATAQAMKGASSKLAFNKQMPLHNTHNPGMDYAKHATFEFAGTLLTDHANSTLDMTELTDLCILLAQVTINDILDREVRASVAHVIPPTQWWVLLPQVHFQV